MSDLTFSEHQSSVLEYPGVKRDRGLTTSPDKLGRTSADILGRDFLSDIEKRIQAGHPVSVIEMGCGVGNTIKELKQKYPNISAKGIDLRVHPENAGDVELREMDMEDSETLKKEFGVESADVIYSVMAYRYLEDKLKFLSTVYDLLKSNGSAYIDIGDLSGLTSPNLNELIKRKNLSQLFSVAKTEDDFGHLNYVLKMQKDTPKPIDWGVSFESLEKPAGSVVGISEYGINEVQ